MSDTIAITPETLNGSSNSTRVTNTFTSGTTPSAEFAVHQNMTTGDINAIGSHNVFQSSTDFFGVGTNFIVGTMNPNHNTGLTTVATSAGRFSHGVSISELPSGVTNSTIVSRDSAGVTVAHFNSQMP